MERAKTLTILSVGCVCLAVATTSRADFVGVVSEILTDPDTANLCGAANGDFVPFPLTVCNIFAVFEDPTDLLLGVAFADITTTDPAGFFQHHPFGLDTPYSCILLGGFPDLICDSFVTIGEKCAGEGGTVTDPDFDSNEFNNNGHIVGGWIIPNWPAGQGHAGNYPNNQVLFLQLSVRPGESVSGQVDLHWCDVSCSGGPASILVVEDLLLECSGRGECPAGDDGDGRVTICHIPPGNSDNAHTITVSIRALPAHLAHGDHCGPCAGDGGLPLSSSQSIAVPVGHRFSKMIE